MVRHRGERKRALGMRAPLALPSVTNERWSLDFVHDQMVDGWRLRILAVVDDCTRECLALAADTSLSGLRVARELDRIAWASSRRRPMRRACKHRVRNRTGRSRRALALRSDPSRRPSKRSSLNPDSDLDPTKVGEFVSRASDNKRPPTQEPAAGEAISPRWATEPFVSAP